METAWEVACKELAWEQPFVVVEQGQVQAQGYIEVDFALELALDMAEELEQGMVEEQELEYIEVDLVLELEQDKVEEQERDMVEERVVELEYR
jgi:nucleoside-specific outer membrane channel protein Tsx